MSRFRWSSIAKTVHRQESKSTVSTQVEIDIFSVVLVAISQLVRGQCTACALSCSLECPMGFQVWPLSMQQLAASRKWTKCPNQCSSLVMAHAQLVRNLDMLDVFVHYLIAARILLATTRPCDVSNTMAHAWIVHYFTHASRAIFSQQ